MLDVVLALDGVADVIELFEIDEAFQSVPFGEAIDKSGTMLEYAAADTSHLLVLRDRLRERPGRSSAIGIPA